MSADRPDYARELRASLVDPHALAVALHLDEGMKRQPRGVLVRCPVHEERNASCSVRVADDGTIAANCFTCGFSADALGLIAQVRNHDPRADFRAVLVAAAELAGRYDVLEALEGRATRPVASTRVTAPRPIPRPTPTRDARREQAAHAFVDLAELDHTPRDGWAYLEARGIVAHAIALGCKVLPVDHAPIVAALLKVASREDLQHASVLRVDRDVLEWSEHRLVIPWRRRDGSIAIVQRRLMRGERDGERKYQVQRGPMVELEPFGAHAFAQAAESMPDADVVIVEGALDVAARMRLAMMAGERVLVVGSFNVTAHATHDWRPFVLGRRVRVALDADEAGEKNAPMLAAVVAASGATDVVRERPRGGSDWNEALLAQGRRAA